MKASPKMPRKLSKTYFDNKRQQAQIKQAILAAIPPDVYYFNVILALTELPTWAANQEHEDNLFMIPPTPPR